MTAKAENKNAPWLAGWLIALAMGALACAVAIVVGEYRYTIAGFIGVLVATGAGLLMGMPWGAGRNAAAAPMPARVAPAAATVTTAPAAAIAESAVAVAPAEPAAAPALAPAGLMAAPAPAPVAAATATATVTGGPEQLSGPRGGVADNLKEIEGIGPALEKLCHELGFYHFDQIAGWSDGDVAWVDANMKTFKGRILRDKWVAQARIIVAEGLDAFRLRAKTNDY